MRKMVRRGCDEGGTQGVKKGYTKGVRKGVRRECEEGGTKGV